MTPEVKPPGSEVVQYAARKEWRNGFGWAKAEMTHSC